MTRKPVLDVLDLLGRRGALRILWSIRKERLTFRALVEAAESNPSTVNTRLAELRKAGLIDLGGGYGLTAQGKTLMAALKPLRAWAKGWKPAPPLPKISASPRRPTRS
jgi:DNA-binding HxlR family transcriptional regulator